MTEEEREHIDLDDFVPDADLAQLLPLDFAVAHKVVPVVRTGDLLVVACSDSVSQETLARVSELCGMKVKALIAERESIERAIEKIYVSPQRRQVLYPTD